MSEYALTRVRPSQLEDLLEEGQERAAIVLKIMAKSESYLSSIQLGITLSSLSLGLCGLYLIMGLMQGFLDQGAVIVIGFLLIALIHVVLGELVPRAVALSNIEEAAMTIAYPLIFFHYLLYPLVAVSTKTSRLIQSLLGIKKPKENIARSEEELRKIVRASEKEGELDQVESRLIGNVFDFADRVAREIMVPRQDMVCLFADEGLEENLMRVRSSGHTRYPLCIEEKDHVLGTIHVRDLLDIRDKAFDLRKLMRPINVVAEAAPITNVLQLMQRQHVQMVLVADEYGGTAGLITMEDLVEEIVGEIKDEHEANRPEEVVRLPEGGYEFDGMVLLDNISKLLKLEFADVEEDTIGGYVFGLLERRPQVGDPVIIGHYCFKVLAVEGFRVVRVQAKPLPVPSLAGPGRENGRAD